MLTDSRIRWCGLVFLLIACGGGNDDGGNGGGDPPDPPPVVTVTPVRDTLTVGTSVQLIAGVAGTGNTDVTWSAVGGGSVSAAGLYTAGTSASTALVIATSVANAAGKDTATIVVVAAPGGTLTVTDSAIQGQRVVASVPDMNGLRYHWTVTGGTIADGQGTATLGITAGGGSLLQVSCIVSNLADSSITVSGQAVLVAGPTTTSFIATRDTLTQGESTNLIPVFEHGSATIDHGIGAVTSGSATPTEVFNSPYVPVTYTLTVTGFRGRQDRATAAVVAVKPPQLAYVRVYEDRVPAGGRARLFVNWTNDPGVKATFNPGNVNVPVGATFNSAILPTPGNYPFTVTVRTPADSSLTLPAMATAVPATAGSVVPGPSMKEARGSVRAVPLADGRVLVTGGTANGRSTEIYNPQTNQFSYTDSMAFARTIVVAVRAADGRVLASGATAQSEWYDPTPGTWSLGPLFPELIEQMVLLSSGRILVIGGFSNTTFLYNPVTDSLNATGTLSQPFWALFPLPGDRALLVSQQTRNTLIYDASTGTTAPTGSMLQAHIAGAFTQLPSGKIMAVGGEFTFSNDSTAGAEIYDPATGQWTATGPLAIPRYRLEAVQLTNGKILIAGGSDRSGALAGYAELFDESTGTFTPTLGTLTQLVNGLGAAALPNGQAIFLGGWLGLQYLGTAVTERFLP